MNTHSNYFRVPDVESIATAAAGPSGSLPLSDEILRQWTSGDLFGLTQSVGMGFDPRRVLGDQYLILSTQGGVRAPDGSPIALGYHTGHWEVGLLVQAAAEQIETGGGVPFAAFVSDPCDGRTQGTKGMFDSLPYRNDAAIVMRRLIRSLPQRKGVIGIATCDKGLPAMLMAVAGCGDRAGVVVPGGVTLPPVNGEDAGKVQTIGARYTRGEMTLQEASDAGCRACGTPGGGCQFLGTAATAQVVAEALGLTVPHAALAPSGQPIWTALARDSATAVADQVKRGVTVSDILTEDSIFNAMLVHAAVGGSTNLLLHIPAIAHAAGLPRPDADAFSDINRMTSRFVDCLPNGPVGHPTVRMFLAGGVPEVAFHLREMGLFRGHAITASGMTWDEVIDQWMKCERREICRDRLQALDGVDPDDVIMPPPKAKAAGLTSTVCFPKGNLCPEGSVIKATSIDPTVVDSDGVYRKRGPARVFCSERDAIAAVKGQTEPPIKSGDVIVLIGRGPIGCGMEETYQITSALKYLSFGKEVALITDARFSGVSTGACIGHVGPEALAGGPIARVRDGDMIDIFVDRVNLTGHVNLVGDDADAVLSSRSPHPDLKVDPGIPEDTRLWAALQQAGGGTWGGCVYDVDEIVKRLRPDHSQPEALARDLLQISTPLESLAHAAGCETPSAFLPFGRTHCLAKLFIAYAFLHESSGLARISPMTANSINSLAQDCVAALARSDQRLVLAESFTGGLIAATLTGVPGVSQYFCGSAVTYRNATKTAWLGVDEDVIEQQTAVCEDVARMMAAGVLSKTAEASIAVSITGHLGPDAPDGFDGIVFLGVASRTTVKVERHILTANDRGERQSEAVRLALRAIIDICDAKAG